MKSIIGTILRNGKAAETYSSVLQPLAEYDGVPYQFVARAMEVYRTHFYTHNAMTGRFLGSWCARFWPRRAVCPSITGHRLEDTRGLPEVITVDNGPEFAGKVFARMQ